MTLQFERPSVESVVSRFELRQAGIGEFRTAQIQFPQLAEGFEIGQSGVGRFWSAAYEL